MMRYLNMVQPVRYNKENAKKIYDPKSDNSFKYIFGPNNERIMKRLLTDFLPFTFDEGQKMVYIQPTLTNNEYIDNEKKPIVDINVEIGTEEAFKKAEENRQSSFLYSNKKDRKGKNDEEKANENENESKNDNEKETEKEGEEEKEKLKKIIVQMKVYDDKDFSRNIMIDAVNSYATYCTGNKYEEIVDVYSLNFIYIDDLFEDKKNNNSSKSKNSKYIHDMYINDPSDYEEYCLPNIHIFIVELSKFDINNFNEDDAKDLWTAFFKCITYKVEYNKKRKYGRDSKTVKIILNDLTEDLYKKLSKIDEIKEAIDICEVPVKKGDGNSVEERYYNNYVNSVFNDEKVLVLEKMNEELENEKNVIQTKLDAAENEKNAMQTRVDALESENKDIRSKYESLMKELEELKNKLIIVNN